MDVEGYINQFENLNIRHEPQYRDINILLVGETGVGKSTFINAFANYARYQNFDEAINGELQILAPTLISLTNKNNESINIQIGSHDDKKQEVGAAGTTDVTSYFLPLPSLYLRLRLIDSPGIGDPDGVDQDDINIEKILNYLADLEELHAICFVMKPSTTRNNVIFDYCLKQLMSRLEISASQNIIFVFTNTRGTFYHSGDTKPCLEKIINDIKSKPPYVKIPFEHNVFCLDNEAFKFIVAIQRNIKLNSYAIENSKNSWDVSSKACEQLIYYIIGADTKPALRPHLMRNTINVNKAKVLIDQHSEPLAEVCELIDHNIRILDKHKDDLSSDRQDLKELRRKLYIPNLTFKIVPLGHTTAVVCTSPKCTKYLEVNGVKQHVFEQICQHRCNLKYELMWKFRSKTIELLKFCRVMSRSICTKCGCHFSKHILTSNLKSTVSEHILDKGVANEIESKVALLERKQALIKEIEQKTKQHEKELNDIIESVAKFAHFLQINSISSFSDSFIEEITSLIEREENFNELANREKIDNLRKTLQKYEKARLRYSENTENFASVDETVRNIEETIDKLYKLEYSGKIIKDLFEKQKKTRNWLFNINIPDEANSGATTFKQSQPVTRSENISKYSIGEQSKSTNTNLGVAPIHMSFARAVTNTNDFLKFNCNKNSSIYPPLSQKETDVKNITGNECFQLPKSTAPAKYEQQNLTFGSTSSVTHVTNSIEVSNNLNDKNEGVNYNNVDKSSLSLAKKVESVSCQTDLDSNYFKRYEEYLKVSQKQSTFDGFQQKDIYFPYSSYSKQSSQQFALEHSQYDNYYAHTSRPTLPQVERRPNPDFGAVSNSSVNDPVSISNFPQEGSYYNPSPVQDNYYANSNIASPLMTRGTSQTNVRSDARYKDYSSPSSQGQFYNRPEPYYDHRYHSSSEHYNKLFQGRANDEVYSERDNYRRNHYQYDMLPLPQARSNNFRPYSANYGQNWDEKDQSSQFRHGGLQQHFLHPRQ